MTLCASLGSYALLLPELSFLVTYEISGAFILFGAVILEIKPRVSGMLGKHFATSSTTMVYGFVIAAQTYTSH